MAIFTESLAIISENIKSLVHSLTTRKLVFSIFVIIFISIVVALSLNFSTGTFYFSRINKKIDTIERIENKSFDAKFKTNIEKEYGDILSELSEYKTKKSFKIDRGSNLFNVLLKILISLIVPFLILIASTKDENFKNIFLGVIMFMFFFGTVSAIIPVIYKLWLTGIIIIVFEAIVLTIMSKVFK